MSDKMWRREIGSPLKCYKGLICDVRASLNMTPSSSSNCWAGKCNLLSCHSYCGACDWGKESVEKEREKWGWQQRKVHTKREGYSTRYYVYCKKTKVWMRVVVIKEKGGGWRMWASFVSKSVSSCNQGGKSREVEQIEKERGREESVRHWGESMDWAVLWTETSYEMEEEKSESSIYIDFSLWLSFSETHLITGETEPVSCKRR